MRALKPVLVGLVTVGIAIAAAGCGSGSGSSSGSSSTASTPEVAAPTGDAAITQDGKSVTPGAKLKYGESVTITAKQELGDPGDYTAHLKMTVKEVKPGAAADLQSLSDASQYSGKSPVYVYIELEVLDIAGGNDGTVIKPGYRAMVSEKDEAKQLIIFGNNDGPLCAGGVALQASRLTDHGVLAAGMKTLDCGVFLVEDGQKVKTIAYRNQAFGKDQDDPYRQSPITWSA